MIELAAGSADMAIANLLPLKETQTGM